MVSRAVERKKQRKEKKLHRDENCAVPNVTKPPPKDDDDDNYVEPVESDYFGGHANNAGYSNYQPSDSTAKVASTSARKTFSADDDDEAVPVATISKKAAPTNKKTPTIAEPSQAVLANDDEDGDADVEVPAVKVRRVEKKAVDESENTPQAVSAAPIPASHIVTKLTNLDRPLTRKERLKLETAQRLEKQLVRQQRLGERLDAAEAEALQEYKEQQRQKKKAAAASASADGEGDGEATEAAEEAEDDNEIAAPKLPEIASRHDERFIGGTYWKERKDRKRRTLFVGNLPMYYDQHTTKDYIVGILESHGVVDGTLKDEILESKMMDFAAGKMTDAGPAFNRKADKDGGYYGALCPVLSIDFLSNKANAKTRHAYVCFRTVDVAIKARDLLDGSKPEIHNSNKLRVNFSDDKDQRDAAINKREGSKSLRGGRGSGRGFGGRGAGRGVGGGRGSSFNRGSSFGRGGARGGSRGGGFSRGRGSMGGGRGRTFGPGFGYGPGREAAAAGAPAATSE